MSENAEKKTVPAAESEEAQEAERELAALKQRGKQLPLPFERRDTVEMPAPLLERMVDQSKRMR